MSPANLRGFVTDLTESRILAMLGLSPGSRAMPLSVLAASAVVCLLAPVAPSVCDAVAIEKVADFPGGFSANRGIVTTRDGEMLARVATGGDSYARGVVDLDRRVGRVGQGGRLELAGRFRFDAGSYVSVMRADDFAARPDDAIQLGVERQAGDGRLHIAARRYDGSWTGFDVAAPLVPVAGREYALRLVAEIAPEPGLGARTTLWVDGREVAATTQPNVLPERAYTKARLGVVAVAGTPAMVAMRELSVRAEPGVPVLGWRARQPIFSASSTMIPSGRGRSRASSCPRS